jgi:cell division septation protein DedD
VAGVAVLLAVAFSVYAYRGRQAERAALESARPTTDSARTSPTTDALVADAPPATPPANPADSANASAFAVELGNYSTEAGAMLKLQQLGDSIPGATYAPVVQSDRGIWYRLTAGAFSSRSSADSLLTALRAHRALPPGGGSVTSLPLALLLSSGETPTTARPIVATLRERGIPAYALVQKIGTVSVYAGTFATPREATSLITSLASANIQATLVYRVGRPL